MRTILVTGAAGFIGHRAAERLLEAGERVVGVDAMPANADAPLREARLARIAERPGFDFRRLDLADRPATADLFADVRPERVIHLAAQVGVRQSVEAPHAYVDNNVQAFVNVLEGCRHAGVGHLVYASSSSIYGLEGEQPFRESAAAAHPVSLYAATKRANELMAHSYGHLFGLPTTGVRFFTVYGPWGRPDMALFLFTRAMLAGRPIPLFGDGRMERDFTYVDDIVDGLRALLDHVPAATGAEPCDPGVSPAPYRVYNLGHGEPVALMDLVRTLEAELGVEAKLELLPMQPGEVSKTWADTRRLEAAIGYRPKVGIAEGVRRFVRWYRDFYGV